MTHHNPCGDGSGHPQPGPERGTASATPNPGSPEAVRLGCSCPRMDNEHGRGYGGMPNIFVYTVGCPLHNYPSPDFFVNTESFPSLDTSEEPDPGHDPVNHPAHYTGHPSGVECIEITEHMGFCLGNAMKYLWRADLKGGVEDLRKAAWYIEREIAKRQSKEGTT